LADRVRLPSHRLSCGARRGGGERCSTRGARTTPVRHNPGQL